MSAFLSDLSQIATWVFGVLSQVFNLYTGTVILACVLGLWLLRQVVSLFRKIL